MWSIGPVRCQKKEIIQSKRALYHGALGDVKFFVPRFLSWPLLKGLKDRLQIRLKCKGLLQLAAHSDQMLPRHQDSKSLARMARMVQDAKKDSDHVVVLGHCGGQFNETPEPYVKVLEDFFSASGSRQLYRQPPSRHSGGKINRRWRRSGSLSWQRQPNPRQRFLKFSAIAQLFQGAAYVY
ncbi:hypothetical protein ABB02_02011 [Clostridiaceae bacterium JG1575]|nr:hypothetical protein ABB02_02011 [Clostridiaceae bacterium JG1575]